MIVAMSAREVIDQIKHLSLAERVQVVHYVVENDDAVSAGKAAVITAAMVCPSSARMLASSPPASCADWKA
jgi:hypothetical protein